MTPYDWMIVGSILLMVASLLAEAKVGREIRDLVQDAKCFFGYHPDPLNVVAYVQDIDMESGEAKRPKRICLYCGRTTREELGGK